MLEKNIFKKMKYIRLEKAKIYHTKIYKYFKHIKLTITT